MRHGSHRVAGERRPVGRLVDRRHGPHVDGCRELGGSRPAHRHRAKSGIGVHGKRRVTDNTRAIDGCMHEASNAIATHLRRRSVGVEQSHREFAIAWTTEHQQAVGRESRFRVAPRNGTYRKISARDLCLIDDEKVVAQTGVLVDRHHGKRRLPQVFSHGGHDFFDRITFNVNPAYAGVTTEPSLLAYRELARVGDDRRDGFTNRHPSPQVLGQLRIAEGL
jgi:hypothetical protein